MPNESRCLLFDIETDGLLDAASRVHCICARDADTGRLWSFGPNGINDGLDLLASAALLVAHNGLCFDIPVLRKLYPERVFPPVFDTLTASRLIWTNLKDLDCARLRSRNRVLFPLRLVGSHSLKAWGYRLGEFKDDYGETAEDAWACWTPELQAYCEQDVEVLHKLYRHILKQDYSQQALELEHAFQTVIFRQEQDGVLFDTARAERLYVALAGRRAELVAMLQEAFPPIRIEEEFIPARDNKTKGYVKGVPFIKVRYEEFNPTSRQQIGERLIAKYGWKPVVFTETGQPQVDEEVLTGVNYPEASLLLEHLELSKIMGMLADGNNAWLKLVEEKTSRIHGRVITNGAVTGRCTHSRPNLAQIPVKGEYGKECRSLFVAPPGQVQVGTDASGLELRMLAHYMARYDGGAYVETLLQGDIHTANQKAAGLETRDDAKRFIYAFLYGAGDVKLGSIVAPGKSESTQAKHGKQLKQRFFRSLPAVKALITDVTNKAKQRGWLLGLDKRLLHVRSTHSALNLLLQSAGAVLVKKATCIFHREMEKQGLVCGKEYTQILHIHDEWQCYCKPDIADALGTTAVRSIELAGEYFNLRCPVTGEYRIGASWAETH